MQNKPYFFFFGNRGSQKGGRGGGGGRNLGKNSQKIPFFFLGGGPNVYLEAFSSSNTFLYLSHSLVANKRGDECQAQVQIAKKEEYGKKGIGRCSFCWRMEMPIRH